MILTAVRERCKDLPDDADCLCKKTAFVNLGKGKERKTVVTAIVHVDLTFTSSEIGDPNNPLHASNYFSM